MMPCLAITGADGFIGRHLTRDALARGWSVKALSRNTQWLESISPTSKLSIHKWDLAHPQEPRIFDGVDAVCHLAAILPKDYEDPRYAQECLLNNSLATLHLLKAAGQSDGVHFIYYSSGNSYARQDRMVHETDPLFPSGHAVYYLASKVIGEMYCEHFRLKYRHLTTTLRLSSVYGPGQASGVLPKFIERLSAGSPIELHDGGQHTADFVFVEDVIKVTWSVIERKAAGIYNIGSGQVHSILEVAQTIAECTRASSDLLQVQPTIGATPGGFSGLDITKARTELGYEPTSLRVGLTQFVNSMTIHDRT